eukprot:Phypoly_transcript_05504.p1 GENE.Phypoly_transcript_05504~~Phypoly_transcript_05504.p1  ORF type:complete len:562 (+),score=67.26 Phypoly_transcript_05504:186-1871(+)
MLGQAVRIGTFPLFLGNQSRSSFALRSQTQTTPSPFSLFSIRQRFSTVAHPQTVLRQSSTTPKPTPAPPKPTPIPHTTPPSSLPKSIFIQNPRASSQSPQPTNKLDIQVQPHHSEHSISTYQPPLDQKKNAIRKTPKNIGGKTSADLVAYFENLYHHGVASYPLRFAKAILKHDMTDEQVEKLFVMARNTASATTEVYNSTMIHFYENPDQVLAYFDLLKSDGRKPDSTSYDCLIKAYIKKGLEGKVKEVLATIMPSATTTGDVVLLEKTLAKVLQYFSELGQAVFVLELYHIYVTNIPHLSFFNDARTYFSIIHSLLKCDCADEAWALMQAAIKKSFTPNISTWGAVMAGMKRKNTDMALAVYSKLLELKLKPDVGIYFLLFEIYSSKAMPDKMLEVYDTLTSEGYILGENMLIKFFEQLTQTSPIHAIQFLKEMEKFKSTILPTKENYTKLIKQLSIQQTNEIRTVITSAQERHGSVFAATLSNKLVQAHALSRDWVSALHVIDTMFTNAVLPTSKSVTFVIECMVNEGKSTQAKQVINNIIQKGVKNVDHLVNQLPQQ